MKQATSLLKTLLNEESDYQFSTFTNNTAYEIGTRIIERAFKEGHSIVIDIQMNDERIFYTRMDAGTANNDDWVRRKNNTVHHFNHSSYYMHEYFKSVGESLETHSLNPKEYAAEGGAFPLIIKGEGIVGTITVSGLQGHEDHGMVTAILKDYFQSK